jgi:hypothetical protein
MTVTTDENGNPVVKCECGHKFVGDGVLKWRVALAGNDRICPKCPQCKRFTESFPIKILLGGQ